MKILANKIAKELKNAKQCGVYEPELPRVWPAGGESREPKIAAFAELHGWRLRYYKDGFCALFDKDPFLLNNRKTRFFRQTFERLNK